MVRSRRPEIETVLRKFNPWEQNLEISSPSLTSYGKLGLLTQGRGEGQRTEADERTRTADLVSLRVNCSYWTILCFTLLDNRRYQHERRSVMRCNERLVVCVFIFERFGEGTSDIFAGDLTPLP